MIDRYVVTNHFGREERGSVAFAVKSAADIYAKRSSPRNTMGCVPPYSTLFSVESKKEAITKEQRVLDT